MTSTGPPRPTATVAAVDADVADAPVDDPLDRPAPAPRWARGVALVVLALVAVAFLVPVKFTFWPITSWELFSRVRSSDARSYQVAIVDADGEEAPLPFSRLGRGHRRWLFVARTLPSSTGAERAAICRSWADAAAAELGPDAVAEVRVYRTVLRAADRIQDPPSLVERDLYLTCEPA